MMTSSSQRFEDLKDELNAIKDKIRVQSQHNLNELTFRRMSSEGDQLVYQMRRELTSTPAIAQKEMLDIWTDESNQWQAFKQQMDDHLRSATSAAGNDLSRGIAILERTSNSVQRAEMVSRETEAIGQEVIGELGEQREALTRTRDRLDGTNHDLKRSNVILRQINRRLLTNKCLLIVIILIEILILMVVVYFKYLRPKK
ncbi:uncharacterized protein LOC128966148 [Oppia nitens]|uniref:uncharacterized protein LOC128966148 n=1 Tax=Oppia nitens TaxID=1686743 RepID=UPI0023DB57C2|nr:uncharacterized protein LOC128966148 [Oppia nitens]